jgi:hypothetical protein
MEFSLLLGRISNSRRVEIIATFFDNVTLPEQCFVQIRGAMPLAIPAKTALYAAGGWW